MDKQAEGIVGRLRSLAAPTKVLAGIGKSGPVYRRDRHPNERLLLDAAAALQEHQRLIEEAKAAENRASSEVKVLRETNRKLHRRAQNAEGVVQVLKDNLDLWDKYPYPSTKPWHIGFRVASRFIRQYVGARVERSAARALHNTGGGNA